jgi:hypothetical protein
MHMNMKNTWKMITKNPSYGTKENYYFFPTM